MSDLVRNPEDGFSHVMAHKDVNSNLLSQEYGHSTESEKIYSMPLRGAFIKS